MRKYIKNFIPEILDWKFNSNGISFYEMSYIEGKNLDLNKFKIMIIFIQKNYAKY